MNHCWDGVTRYCTALPARNRMAPLSSDSSPSTNTTFSSFWLPSSPPTTDDGTVAAAPVSTVQPDSVSPGVLRSCAMPCRGSPRDHQTGYRKAHSSTYRANSSHCPKLSPCSLTVASRRALLTSTPRNLSRSDESASCLRSTSTCLSSSSRRQGMRPISHARIASRSAALRIAWWRRMG